MSDKRNYSVDIESGRGAIDAKASNPSVFTPDIWSHTKPSASDCYIKLLSPWSLKFSALITTSNWYRWLLMSSGPFEYKPFNKSLIARACSSSLATGTADTNTVCRLVDVGSGDFSDVTAGDVVYNSTDDVYAVVLIKVSSTILQLDWDAFPDGDEDYVVYNEPDISDNFIYATGSLLDGDGSVAADTNTANHLLDADGTDWTTDVSVDDWAMNLQTGKVAKITAVAAHDLTLQWDCFPNGNEEYAIFANKITVSDSDSLINGFEIPEMNISQRYVGAGLTSGLTYLDMIQSHIMYSGVGEDASADFGIYGNTTDDVPGEASQRATGTGGLDKQVKTSSPKSDGEHGEPRTGEVTRPRTLTMTYIMRIK